MPRILLTNDDGVAAEGLLRLADALADLGDLVVVAPDRQQSAMSHALTLHRPLRIDKLGEDRFAVDGTPTDCVNLAILWLLKDDRPDLILSGINFGLNLGDDVTYSGTVSATFEGSLLGIPAVAFSQQVGEGFSFDAGARFARGLVERLLERPLQPGMLLNVNFPNAPFEGVEITRLGRREYKQSIVEKLDPRGRKYYWIAGTPEWEEADGTDHAAVSTGKVSVTPLHLDLTDYREIVILEDSLDELRGLISPEAPDDEGPRDG